MQHRIISLINFLFYFWLQWVFVAAHGISLVAVSEGYYLVTLLGLLIAEAQALEQAGFTNS